MINKTKYLQLKKPDGDEFYEEFQRIYNESVGRNAGKEKVEDKMWNMGRGSCFYSKTMLFIYY